MSIPKRTGKRRRAGRHVLIIIYILLLYRCLSWLFLRHNGPFSSCCRALSVRECMEYENETAAIVVRESLCRFMGASGPPPAALPSGTKIRAAHCCAAMQALANGKLPLTNDPFVRPQQLYGRDSGLFRYTRCTQSGCRAKSAVLSDCTRILAFNLSIRSPLFHARLHLLSPSVPPEFAQ